ncbi:glycogen synthase, ADP-glucose transglucosylase [Piscinibacter sakaiensis]|uniref:Glycogen synthase n=1 Tax=Piscinibacter sakaiensis TaxID=1547922 RepID=A0A0K8P5F0_PISS1|nr:glycogen synthase, ADP-glucose transglucosylase [Piscinibacter sakaiensis]
MAGRRGAARARAPAEDGLPAASSASASSASSASSGSDATAATPPARRRATSRPPAPAPAVAPAGLPVLGVASELFPLLKTGGLADVSGALPQALAPHGVALRTLLPGHPAVLAALADPHEAGHWPDCFGGPARLLVGRHAGLDLLVLDAPHLYDRPGNPYLGPDGRDWPDNAVRYAALGLAAARLGWGDFPGAGPVPAVLHLHDWQAALAPAYLHYLGDGRPRPATVLTLHNLAFQGRFGADAWPRLGLPPEAFAMQGLEYHGDIGFLKAGIHFADAITTVSPTYAQEILGLGGGMGLDAMLRWRAAAVSGIVNGIDTAVWDPATDGQLAARYDASTLAARRANRQAVEAAFGLPEDPAPLVCMISRLTAQKGIDLVAAALDAIVAEGARLVVLGTGDPALEDALRAGAQRHPTRVAVRIGYDEALSHRLQGGADMILVPSRFEPCGLTQLCGLRYGCVPIVSRVGGLADTVIDANVAALRARVATGIQFGTLDAEGVLGAVRRAVALFRQPAAWAALQRAGMAADVGWDDSARTYAALYRRVAAARRPLPV